MIGVWNSIYFRRFENDPARDETTTAEGDPMTTETGNLALETYLGSVRQ
ncbi:hypothetical protein CRE_05757 [Caenorhabditis remanei]|uniref:Uncharacterized protein n=1 Tax=Caenorhabditis remanei TaxID=31234 RepID=E3LZX8_CAERE|nr:hypothetical protein CRE_05757 [Caenorhabditis remanei]